MTLARSTDAAFLNRVVNHPEVARWMVGFLPPFDFTAVLRDPANIFLANEHGGFLFIGEPDVYEVHTQFLPEGRGQSFELAREAAWHIFTQTDALAIRTYVPEGNEAAKRLTERMGFVFCDQVTINGHDADVYILNLKKWARSLCQPQQ